MFKIKFCGIKDKDTANFLIDNFSAYKLIFGFRIGKRKHHSEISIDEANEIINTIDNKALPVIATYLKDSDKILELCKNFNTKWLQVTDLLENSELTKLKENGYNIVLSLNTSKINFEKNNKQLLTAYDLIILTTNTFYPDWSKISFISSHVPYEKTFIGGWLHPESMLYAVKHVLPSGINIDFNILNYTFGNTKNLIKYINDFQKTFELFSNINGNGGRS